MAATLTAATFQPGVNFRSSAAKPAQVVTNSTVLSAVQDNQSKSWQLPLIFGTGTGYVNAEIIQVRELAAGANETLNLFDGSLLDVFGNASGLSNLKSIIIQLIANTDGSTVSSSITIGNAASNQQLLWFGAAAHTWTLSDILGLPFIAGDTVGKTVDANHCNVKIVNNDGSHKATYLLALAGVHV